ncbi:MAG: hypothetical protein PsegKO_36340 [Pseudohongiellaceae bacterium]
MSCPIPKTLLALDLGTTTGWALRLRDGTITSGTFSLKNSRYEGGGMRYLRFRSWLDELEAPGTMPELIVFEEVRRHLGTDAAHVYGGLLATLTTWCERRILPYQGVPVGSVKKHATGKGNASKQAIIEAMVARGHAPVDDNEADALAILHFAIEGGLA